MQITVAGEKTEVKEGLTVGELLEIKQVETPEYVTVSLNDDFLKRENRDDVVLKEGDVVEFIYFMGGGACL